jgi:hypothetical protein
MIPHTKSHYPFSLFSSAVSVLLTKIKNEMGVSYSTHGREEWYILDLVGKPGGKRPFGRPRSRWEDNIRVEPQGVEWDTE